MLPLYEITYAITNILHAYITYMLMRVFFDDVKTSRKTEFMSYAGYYIISSGAFFLVRIPIVMMGVNLLLFLCLTLNYRATIKKRILNALLAFMILMCIEALVAVLTGLLSIEFFASSQYSSITGVLMVRVASLLIVSIISNLKNVRKDIPVPNFYWFSIVFISAASLYLFVVFFSTGQLSQVETVLVITIILTINLIVLILYDNLYKAFSFREEKLILEQQNAAYEKQMDLMSQSLKTTSLVRHDMKNHMLTLKEFCASHRFEETEEYINKMLTLTDKSGNFVDSGHYVIDSVINFKLQAAIDMGIKPDIEIAIPWDIKIPPYVITVILGNLLDNALTALEKYSGTKKLTVSVHHIKDNLIIAVINSYDGSIKEKDGKPLSLKNEDGHGLGLMSVEETLREHDGYLEIQYDGQVFKASALLPTS